MSEDTRRNVPSGRTLDDLKKQAKRWLKKLLAADAQALERFRKAHPDPPQHPVLRDVQLALARERGAAGWAELKAQLDAGANRSDVVDWFLQQACSDWRLGGPSQQVAAQQSAMRLLDRHPWLARHNLYTAVACGELREVERILGRNPQTASERGGVKDWLPIHYLCFARLPLPATNDNATAIARALFDAGADPNADFQIGIARHTPLVGVIGEGEERRTPHPQAEALISLLLERGAEPCDTQVIYNVNQGNHPCRWLDLLYSQSAKLDRVADWTTPKHFKDPKVSGLDWLLCKVVQRNDVACAEWLLARGASPNAKLPWLPRSAHEDALHRGLTEVADLLVRHGAAPGVVSFTGEEQFVAACLRLDRGEVRSMLQEHPEYLQSHAAIFAAAERDRADVVEFLLDLGTPIEVQDRQKQRPLHAAAGANAVRAAGLLIDRGAEIDPRESQWNNTPLGHALWANLPEMIELLSRYSRDVFDLVFLGKLERLRQVLSEQPDLGRAKNENGVTPLMRLQNDTPAIIELFLDHGADPLARLDDGRTVADLLRRRGLDEAANLLLSR